MTQGSSVRGFSGAYLLCMAIMISDEFTTGTWNILPYGQSVGDIYIVEFLWPWSTWKMT